MADVTDNFDRTDGELGANWTPVTDALAIVSNKVRGTNLSVDTTERYSGASFRANQFAQARIATITDPGAGNVFLWLSLRCSSVENTHYDCLGATPALPFKLYIQKVVVGVGTTLASHNIEAAAANDVLLATVDGDVISLWRNGQLRLTAVDAAIASGDVGLGMHNSTASLANGEWDDFYAGDFGVSVFGLSA